MAVAGETRTLPYNWYVDPAALRLELERVFRRLWQYAGRADEVAEPGAYFTCRAGDVPIVVVRGRDGQLRAFLNVCRHRGSLLCEGRDITRQSVNEQLQAFYDQFVEKAAASRGSTPERIDALAQGRVWTGQQAKDRGLAAAPLSDARP